VIKIERNERTLGEEFKIRDEEEESINERK
jgi:hypothetical protein